MLEVSGQVVAHGRLGEEALRDTRQPELLAQGNDVVFRADLVRDDAAVLAVSEEGPLPHPELRSRRSRDAAAGGELVAQSGKVTQVDLERRRGKALALADVVGRQGRTSQAAQDGLAAQVLGGTLRILLA